MACKTSPTVGKGQNGKSSWISGVKSRRTKKAPRKSSSAKYKKRRRRERGNRAIKKRVKAEFEFAQRIRKEPSLKEVIEGGGRLQ